MRHRSVFGLKNPIFCNKYLLFALFPILVLACGGGSGKQRTELEVRDGKPVLTMYLQSTTETPNPSEIDQKLAELSPYSVEKTFLVADQATTSGIMLASGNYADILNMREDTTKFIDAGVFIPLEDLIPEHAPNIYRLYKPYWEQIKAADGHIYTIPEILPLNPTKVVASSGPGIGMYVQKAVLDWAGYPVIEDTAQMFSLLRDYMAEYPTIDGLPTIGFAFPAEGWRFGYTLYSHAYLTGYPNESGPLVDCIVGGQIDYQSDPCAGEWRASDPFYQSESFYNVMQQYNRAYLDGLIPKETVVQTHDQYNEKIASGRVLAVFDQGWEIGGAIELLAREKPDRVLYNMPISYDKAIPLYQGVATPNYGAGFGISVNAPDPAAAIQFLDANISKEAILLTNWGIEGVDYEVDAEGKYYRTPEQLERSKDKGYRDEHWGSSLLWVVQGSFDDGNAVIPGNQPSVYFDLLSDGDREVASRYGAQSMAELFAPPSARRLKFSPLWTFSFDAEKDKEFNKVATERNNLVTEYAARLIFAEEGEFETVWGELNQKFEEIPNTEIWLQTWQQKLEQRIASWD